MKPNSAIKVALINNMNNNFFGATRYLRDLGFDAHLYMLKSAPEHFHPQSDTYEDVDKLPWVNEFPISCSLKEWVLDRDYATRLGFLREFDVIIACGSSLAFLNRAGVDIDIVIPYGSDLYALPFFLFQRDNLRNSLFCWVTRFAHYQRQAFRTATYVCSSNSLPLFDRSLKKLGVESENLGIPMLYNKINYSRADGTWRFLDDYDFVVFNHARQLWKTDVGGLVDFSINGGFKRNDRIIEAFSQFIRNCNFKKPLLVLFEYGPDVKFSKELVNSLGIKKYVKFMPLMDRKMIMAGLRKADIGSGSFRENLCCIAGTTYEVLASETPCITHTNKELLNPNSYYFNAPIIDVCSVDEILKVFMDYESDPKKYKSLGIKSRKWFDRNLGEGLAEEYATLIRTIIVDKAAGFAD